MWTMRVGAELVRNKNVFNDTLQLKYKYRNTNVSAYI